MFYKVNVQLFLIPGVFRHEFSCHQIGDKYCYSASILIVKYETGFVRFLHITLVEVPHFILLVHISALAISVEKLYSQGKEN